MVTIDELLSLRYPNSVPEVHAELGRNIPLLSSLGLLAISTLTRELA